MLHLMMACGFLFFCCAANEFKREKFKISVLGYTGIVAGLLFFTGLFPA
jgi:hypothetical protein